MEMGRRRTYEDDTFFISFADAVSALLGISILVLASTLTFYHFKDLELATRHRELLGEVETLKKENGGLKDQLIDHDSLKRELQAIKGYGEGEGGLLPSLEIPGDALFASGSSTLTLSGQLALQGLADNVRVHPRFVNDSTSIIVVEGFTDDEGVGLRSGYRTNWHLSADRAARVVEYLTKNCGLPSNRIAAAGFSQYYPRPGGRARNRYVKLVLISRVTLLEEPQGAESEAPGQAE